MEVVQQLAAAVEPACELDPAGLETSDLQSAAVAFEKAAGRLRGLASTLLGEVDAREPDGVAWWWRDATGSSGEAAGHAVRRARGLRALPELGQAAVDGQLS